jgi:hypothetical protein
MQIPLPGFKRSAFGRRKNCRVLNCVQQRSEASLGDQNLLPAMSSDFLGSERVSGLEFDSSDKLSVVAEAAVLVSAKVQKPVHRGERVESSENCGSSVPLDSM